MFSHENSALLISTFVLVN